MPESEGGEKTEAPTARRRQEAREEGNVARSPDLTGALLMLGALLLMKWFGPGLIQSLTALVGHMLSGESLSDLGTGSLNSTGKAIMAQVGLSLAPLLGGAVVIVVAANVAQVGITFNAERLAPNLTKLNPMNGISRLFSRGQAAVSLVLDLLKVGLVGIAAYSAIGGRLSQIIAAQQLSFQQIFALGADVVFAIGLRVGAVLLVLAIIDYFYQRYKTEQSLRMSKQEVKDEMRRMDGDPLMKQRRRQIARQRAMQKLKKEVPTADVIITNPTHFAIALKYTEGRMRAPRVIAKGVDFMAQRIRELAAEAGIPIVERPTLARAIYRMVDVGKEIPEQFYAAVAEILAYVYELNRRAAAAAMGLTGVAVGGRR